jgi:hypothetical protein
MLRKLPFAWIILFALLFITLGDRILPQPLSGASFKTRTTLNQFVVGLFPGWKPKTNPYERTEKAVKQQEEGN